jgi:hypothetical protein
VSRLKLFKCPGSISIYANRKREFLEQRPILKCVIPNYRFTLKNDMYEAKMGLNWFEWHAENVGQFPFESVD